MAVPDPNQYDAFAAAYDAHAAVAPYNALYDRPASLELLGDVAGLRVLDAACGSGLYAEELLARGAEVVGCDASAPLLERARVRVGDRADLRVHSLDEPLAWIPDGSIDVVLCALAYHYVNDRPGFVGEVHRVLRPGGSFVVSTHHPAGDWARLGGSYFAVEPVTEVWSSGWELTAWRMPLTQLVGELTGTGLLIERLVEPQPLPAMAESHPDAFAKLSTGPGFLFLRLRKPT